MPIVAIRVVASRRVRVGLLSRGATGLQEVENRLVSANLELPQRVLSRLRVVQDISVASMRVE